MKRNQLLIDMNKYLIILIQIQEKENLSDDIMIYLYIYFFMVIKPMYGYLIAIWIDI